MADEEKGSPWPIGGPSAPMPEKPRMDWLATQEKILWTLLNDPREAQTPGLTIILNSHPEFTHGVVRAYEELHLPPQRIQGDLEQLQVSDAEFQAALIVDGIVHDSGGDPSLQLIPELDDPVVRGLVLAALERFGNGEEGDSQLELGDGEGSQGDVDLDDIFRNDD